MIDNYKKRIESTGNSKEELKAVKTEVAQGVKIFHRNLFST